MVPKENHDNLQSREMAIPVVDFSTFLTGTPSQRQQCADAILKAFTTVGFVYLSHALPCETIDKAFSLNKEFKGTVLRDLTMVGRSGTDF
jgi:non-haem dioxygenase in morphine synthesis N-terminal